MPIADLHIPQLGEGLVEVRIVGFLKEPGDAIRRDEPIYTMETDKAEVEIESPTDGVLESWEVAVDDVVPIGAVVAKMRVEQTGDADEGSEPESEEAPVASRERSAAAESRLRNANIPPRTRAYAKHAGLTDEEILEIPAVSSKLMPGDVDRYLAARGSNAGSGAEFEEVPMSARQRTLFYRLTNASSQVVPGTIEDVVPWDVVERVHDAYATRGGAEETRPSKFLLVAWCVAKALGESEMFRSTIVDVNTLRRYAHGNLGIAVALPHDELTTAVVPQADALSFDAFVQRSRAVIQRAREGEDQATKTVPHISLTGMTAFGVRTAVPVVVPPSVATLFVGSPHHVVEPGDDGEPRLARAVHLVLTFDHRIINGVGAASFLAHVKERVTGLAGELGVAD
ncbi:MAG: hypothetical protein GY851_35930 [bacterium]|nr:hypothetical protein [bacterium]